MNWIRRYFHGLTGQFGAGWNRFWFLPSDPKLVCGLRMLIGACALWYVASHTRDLRTWFAGDGILSPDLVQELTAGEPGALVHHFSYLRWLTDPRHLYAAHAAGLIVVAAMVLGIAARLTTCLSVVVVLAYVHRAPPLTGPWEPVLTMLMIYLCLAPSGARYSLDRRLRQRGGRGAPDPGTSWSATTAVRLMQVHVSAFYLMMGLTKLAGDTWWSGDAMWWLIAHSESRLVDLTFLHDRIVLVHLWTHAVVAFELLFGILIWNRAARPLLLALAVPMWIAMALLTGTLGFAVTMLVANMAFLHDGRLVPQAAMVPEHARENVACHQL